VQNMMHNKQLLIIYNPTAGSRVLSKLETIISMLKARGATVDLCETEYEGHATEIARQKASKEYDVIVAAGGDGTIREILNGIYPNKIPVAIIPLGTANVLALELGLKNNVESIVNYILDGKTRRCWLGRLNGCYFSLMLSVGLDAVSVANVNRKHKKYLGKMAYVISYLAAIIKSRNLIYKVIIEDKEYEATNVIVSNGKYYGGNFICAPQASLEDNKLYVLMAKNKGRTSAIIYALLMFMQKYPYSQSVEIRSATKLRIECYRENEPVQIDGDHADYLPVDVSISEDYVNLLFP